MNRSLRQEKMTYSRNLKCSVTRIQRLGGKVVCEGDRGEKGLNTEGSETTIKDLEFYAENKKKLLKGFGKGTVPPWG